MRGILTRYSLLGLIAIAIAIFYFTYNNKIVTPDYNIQTLPPSSFGLIDQTAPPELPDLSIYTRETVVSRTPQVRPGKITLEYVWDSKDFQRLQIKEDINFIADRQRTDDPIWIVIEEGIYDLESLRNALNNDQYLKKTDHGYILRAPLLIRNGGGLIVGNKLPLLMNAPTGAMVICYGKFFAVGSTITSWDETLTSFVPHDEKNSFRPYLVFSSGSEAYIVDSKIQHLGYNSSKAFGLTFTSNRNILEDPKSSLPEQTGWVINSQIEDLYYGYYTYEAKGMVVLRNTFRDNIIYGIDPHDRSENLIIAYNDVSGTKKKHGIIISREVNNSWIIYNNSYNNHGSGVMLDRNCEHNVIAYNDLHHNGNDGLFFSESPNNLSWQNKLNANKKSGLRIRNSVNITSRFDQAMYNEQFGVVVYRADLSDTPRDLKMDPYEQRASADIARMDLSNNARAHFSLGDAESLRLYYNTVLKTPSGKLISGNLPDLGPALYEGLSSRDQGVAITGKYLPRAPLAGPEDSESEE